MPDDRPTTPLSQPYAHPHRRNDAALIEVRGLNLWYGQTRALHDVDFELFHGEILAFMGPSGCGKSTALKCLNRMHDGKRGVCVAGSITLAGQDIQAPEVDPPVHRRRFGWVAQKPNPFPGTIFDNVAYGPAIHGLCADRAELDDHVRTCLIRAQLWDEVAGDLHRRSGLDLSTGQQQRLCIARALSTRPEVMLMDEPTGSIDPIATARVEDLLVGLRADHAIIVVTHSLSQARRIADRVAYFHLGRLLEIGPTDRLFTAPKTPEAAAFLAGRFG